MGHWGVKESDAARRSAAGLPYSPSAGAVMVLASPIPKNLVSLVAF